MSCTIDKSLLEGLMTNQLTNRERLEIDAHLAQCRQCQHQLEAMRQSQQLLATIEPPPLSTDFDLRLVQKITALQSTQSRSLTPPDNVLQRPPRIHQRWLMAASIATTVIGLSWFMLQAPQSDQIALGSPARIIHSNGQELPDDEVILTTHQIIINSKTDQGGWVEADINNFDTFTAVDTGYQSFSCGSTIGDRGCTLGSHKTVASLTVKSSL